MCCPHSSADSQAIVIAHEDMKASSGPINVAFVQEVLNNTSRNRSPSSYLANPISERAEYEQWGGDVDHNMTLLSLGSRGAIAFFAVHGTSMHNTNRLVSSDNKGYAAYLFERAINGNVSAPLRIASHNPTRLPFPARAPLLLLLVSRMRVTSHPTLWALGVTARWAVSTVEMTTLFARAHRRRVFLSDPRALTMILAL